MSLTAGRRKYSTKYEGLLPLL